MRLRFLVGAKLLEVLSRGTFLLFCTYSLPIIDAGKFGMVSTAVGFASFLLGFERVIDVQRRVTGSTATIIHQQLRDTLHFFGFQYVLALPVMALLLGLVTGWPAHILALFILIVIGEHLSNQAYQATLVDRQAYSFLLAVVVKNIIMLAAVFFASWKKAAANFDVLLVINVWSVTSLVFIVVAILLWLRKSKSIHEAGFKLLPRQGIFEQYRASRLHFLMGLVAIIALQADRFVVGAALSAEDIGIYFRNITLAALALQFFNIASFNRVAPNVYQLAREGKLEHALTVVKIEYGRFAWAFVALVGLILTVNFILHNPASRFHIAASFIFILTATILLRTLADYFGLLMLSIGEDTRLFRRQAASVAIGIPCMALMASFGGLPGAFCGTLVTPIILLLLNLNLLRKRFSMIG